MGFKEKKEGGRGQSESLERREVIDLLVLPRPADCMQNGAGFSGKS